MRSRLYAPYYSSGQQWNDTVYFQMLGSAWVSSSGEVPSYNLHSITLYLLRGHNVLSRCWSGFHQLVLYVSAYIVLYSIQVIRHCDFHRLADRIRSWLSIVAIFLPFTDAQSILWKFRPWRGFPITLRYISPRPYNMRGTDSISCQFTKQFHRKPEAEEGNPVAFTASNKSSLSVATTWMIPSLRCLYPKLASFKKNSDDCTKYVYLSRPHTPTFGAKLPSVAFDSR